MKPYLLCLLVLSTTIVGNAQRRIFGPKFAEQGAFPYQVALITHERIHCGGSIISNKFILTAAHCVQSVKSPAALTVVHGSNYWPNGTFAKVSRAITHEKYTNFWNDVALLELAAPLVFDKFTQAIPLRKLPVPTGATVVISGFGSTSYSPNGSQSKMLKYLEVTVVPQESCDNYEGLICFNSPRGTGACNGDSGGPAVYNGELVGVANFIVFRCGVGYPDSYAKVSYFLDWTHEHTEKSLE